MTIPYQKLVRSAFPEEPPFQHHAEGQDSLNGRRRPCAIEVPCDKQSASGNIQARYKIVTQQELIKFS
jgi:hypothetical protein